MTTEEIITNLNDKMQKTADGLIQELTTIRTGRARPALVENVIVDYQGSPFPLRQLASISAPEANLLLVQAWDRTALRGIEKAILKADLGLNPVSDGNAIRISIPRLNEERRNDLAKLIARKVEERRVALRNERRDAIEKLRELEKNKEISQDELKGATKRVQDSIDKFVDRIEKIGQDKEKEIKAV
jgi:ribosome recycling factor